METPESMGGQAAACPGCGKAIAVPEVDPFLELAAAQRADPFGAIHVPQQTTRSVRRGTRFSPIACVLAIVAVLGLLAGLILMAMGHRPGGSESLASVGLVFLVLGAIAAIGAVGMIPGAIASSRGHHNAEAIGMLGVFGILIGILWIAAMVWAYTDPDPLGTRR
jgi:hypothetical protein